MRFIQFCLCTFLSISLEKSLPFVAVGSFHWERQENARGIIERVSEILRKAIAIIPNNKFPGAITNIT